MAAAVRHSRLAPTSRTPAHPHRDSTAAAASHQHHHAAAAGGTVPAVAPSASSSASWDATGDRPISVGGLATAGLAAYREIRSIGRGKFGVCKLVESIATGKQYVMKCIPLSDQSDRERLLALQEVDTLKKLQIPKAHPFIVKYHDSFLYQDSIYICMQHCAGGDLHHFLRERKQTGVYLEETVIIDWLIQLLLAIRRCHSSLILHRDLKTQNIFLVPSSFSAGQLAADAAAAASARAAATQSGFPVGTSASAASATPPAPVTYSVRLGDFGISKILNSTGELAMSVVGTVSHAHGTHMASRDEMKHSSDRW